MMEMMVSKSKLRWAIKHIALPQLIKDGWVEAICSLRKQTTSARTLEVCAIVAIYNVAGIKKQNEDFEGLTKLLEHVVGQLLSS